MVTYNHQDFIEQAIVSVITQETNFSFKLFVGEDCSTDSTREICLKLKSRYPDRIELLFNERNDIHKNSLNVFSACFESGARYIAFLEGDDYWNDPEKLQTQVDFLNENQDYSLSYHQVKTKLMSPEAKEYSYPEIDGYELTLAEAVEKHYIPTASLMFRSAMLKLPDWYTDKRMKSGDIAISLSLLGKGSGYFHRSAMATYRRYAKSLTQTKVITDQLSVLNNYTFIFENLDKDSKGLFRHLFKKRILQHRNGIMMMSLKKGDFISAVKSLGIILKYDPLYLFKRMVTRIRGVE